MISNARHKYTGGYTGGYRGHSADRAPAPIRRMRVIARGLLSLCGHLFSLRNSRPSPLAGLSLALLLSSGATLCAAQGLPALDPERSAPPSLTDAATNPEFLPVAQAYPLAVEVIDAHSLRLIWQMPAGYYLYRHAFRFALQRRGEALASAADYPPALTREDEYFGRVEVYYDRAEVALTAGGGVRDAELSVTSQGCADAGLCYPPRTQRFRIDAAGEVLEVAPRPAAAPVASAAAPVAAASLLSMLLLAFAGGLILNLMPCVLPVLSLKVIGFAGAPAADRHRHGVLYTLGVMLSFLLIALLLIGLRGAGQAVGWGFHLQSSGVVIALGYLFVVMGLGLSGLIELGSRYMNLGSDLAGRGGATGSFFTGVLAVLVASPCTAPFMGTALGYALLQPAALGLSVFAALGAGMAAPMLLLSYSATARRHMPGPGPWMQRLKQALAFPLYATALWLFWVAGRQSGVDVMAAALLGALLIALGLWCWRDSALAKGLSAACLVGAVALAIWRPEQAPGVPGARPADHVVYTEQRLRELRARGVPVFVDVTADWCLTCLANERAVLATEAVQTAFREAGVTYMVADWTDYNAAIADFVTGHGRSGIPLYVLYDGDRPPRLLPQLLRRRTVLDAIRGVQAQAG